MDINVSVSEKATDLCFIMNYYGSDKGNPLGNGHHTYTLIYDPLFRPVRQDAIRVFELGLGTNNLNFPSNMGVDGKPGASLRGWKQFFPKAQVFGADIDGGILFEEERIKTYQCDQNSTDSVTKLWTNPELAVESFDIIIEDGLHIFESNVHFFENSCHKLKKGGVFVIEDIQSYTFQSWAVKIPEWRARYPQFSFRMVQIPNPKNLFDNNILLVKYDK